MNENEMNDPEERGMSNRPSFLKDYVPEEDTSLSEMGQFAKPPRIKVVQALSGEPLKPKFSDGDIIIMPQLTKVGGGDEPFVFTPIHFFPSWSCLNPIQMKGQLPTIREFSFDPNSNVAQKARSFVKEVCPENSEYKLRYSELLNFFIVLHDTELGNMPIILAFFRGEYKTGQNFMGTIQARQAPIYAGKYKAFSEVHSGALGSWHGLAILNASDMWVSEDKFASFKKLHEDLKKLVDTQQLIIDMEDTDYNSGGAANDPKF